MKLFIDVEPEMTTTSKAAASKYAGTATETISGAEASAAVSKNATISGAEALATASKNAGAATVTILRVAVLVWALENAGD